MFGLPDDLGKTESNPLRVLGFGAHADDLEIGCGGTILRLLEERPFTEVSWATFTGGGTPREDEARAAASDFLSGASKVHISVGTFRDGHLPYKGTEAKEYFELNFKGVGPHLVFTHARDDRHQDHRLVSDLAWNTFRGNAVIAEYEIPKWDGDLTQPNTYVVLDEAVAQRKSDLLMKHFSSQHDKFWYDAETFMGLMRLRGVESGTHYAEAFTCRKLVW